MKFTLMKLTKGKDPLYKTFKMKGLGITELQAFNLTSS